MWLTVDFSCGSGEGYGPGRRGSGGGHAEGEGVEHLLESVVQGAQGVQQKQGVLGDACSVNFRWVFLRQPPQGEVGGAGRTSLMGSASLLTGWGGHRYGNTSLSLTMPYLSKATTGGRGEGPGAGRGWALVPV